MPGPELGQGRHAMARAGPAGTRLGQTWASGAIPWPELGQRRDMPCPELGQRRHALPRPGPAEPFHGPSWASGDMPWPDLGGRPQAPAPAPAPATEHAGTHARPHPRAQARREARKGRRARTAPYSWIPRETIPFWRQLRKWICDFIKKTVSFSTSFKRCLPSWPGYTV